MSRLLSGFQNSYLNALEMRDKINEENSNHRMEIGVTQSQEFISELSESLKARKENSNPFQRSLINDRFWDGVESVLKVQKEMGMDSQHRESILKCAQKHFKDFDDGELD